MDNYFTLPQVMENLQDIGIGIVGTTCFRMRWSPKDQNNVVQVMSPTALSATSNRTMLALSPAGGSPQHAALPQQTP
eukprot:1077312-Ditylum_brightwellii.AAC.1